MRKNALLLLAALLCAPAGLSAQTLRVDRVEPPNWWTGMRWSTPQLLLYGTGLDGVTVESSDPAVRVRSVHPGLTPQHAFVTLEISAKARPGELKLRLRKGAERLEVGWPLLARPDTAGRHRGFGPADVIYLITPDRFANGDPGNDTVAGYEEGVDRSARYGRHGGDIRGIIRRLDYLRGLGITAIWCNPLLENNGRNSYHGYAATDLYRIDPRFGTNDDYAELVREAHRRGLKVVLDHVNNHIGVGHPWVESPPMADWLNGTPGSHLPAYHGKFELHDPNSDSLTKARATLGWFAPSMPDMNQRNRFLANYLIQNTIWWMESTGLDGIREDTYPYVDPSFAAEWCAAVRREYPRTNIVGEVWIQNPVYLGPYQSGSPLNRGVDTHLPSVTDFGLYDAFHRVFAESTGVWPLFGALTQDFVYADPHGLVTFLDNHDIARIMYRVREDTSRFLRAMTVLMTVRGIPQILYGTEIGMVGGRDHGSLRADFPGGWPEDARDAFAAAGRTPLEQALFERVRGLIRLRTSRAALTRGRFVHFAPQKEVYCYARVADGDTLFVVLNNGPGAVEVERRKFAAYLGESSPLRDAVTGAVPEGVEGGRVVVPAGSIMVLERP